MALAVAARVLIVLSLALCVLGSRDLKSYTAKNDTPSVPEALAVPSGYKLKQLLSASGDQYYRFNGSSWVNYSAKARLYNQQKKQIGRHYYLKHPDSEGGQPTWESQPAYGVPESLVTGIAVEHVTVDANSIAWVLLKATNNEGSSKYFGKVVYIQRINTAKGLPPSSTSGAHVGDVWVSSYTADYAFYVKK